MNVSPTCLPGSEERVVRVKEGRGNIQDGLNEILSLSCKLGGFMLQNPYSTAKETKINKEEVITQMIDLSKICQQHPWGKIYNLCDRLGAKIMKDASSKQVTVVGHKGAIDMLLSIISMREKSYNTGASLNSEGDNLKIDMETTASHLALICKNPKDIE